MFWHGLFQIPIFVVSLICYSSMIIEQQIRATTKIRIQKSPCQNNSVYYHLPPLLLIYACSQNSYFANTLIFAIEVIVSNHPKIYLEKSVAVQFKADCRLQMQAAANQKSRKLAIIVYYIILGQTLTNRSATLRCRDGPGVYSIIWLLYSIIRTISLEYEWWLFQGTHYYLV